MTQPAPVPDARAGLAESEDLFAFDEVVAASGATPRSPLDADALVDAFDDAHAAVAADAGVAASATETDALGENADALQPALPVTPALPYSRRGWTLAALALGAFALCNVGLVWFALHDASDSRRQMSELSASVLELARRPVQTAAPAPQPLAPVSPAPVATPEHDASERAAERAPALPDYDPDPRREREFAAIEALLAQQQFGEARRQAYLVLARCDELSGVTREVVESRAAYLLARSLGDEAARTPAAATAAVTPSTETAR